MWPRSGLRDARLRPAKNPDESDEKSRRGAMAREEGSGQETGENG